MFDRPKMLGVRRGKGRKRGCERKTDRTNKIKVAHCTTHANIQIKHNKLRLFSELKIIRSKMCTTQICALYFRLLSLAAVAACFFFVLFICFCFAFFLLYYTIHIHVRIRVGAVPYV